MTTLPMNRESKVYRRATKKLQARKSAYDDIKGSSDASRREPGSLKMRRN